MEGKGFGDTCQGTKVTVNLRVWSTGDEELDFRSPVNNGLQHLEDREL